MGNVISHFIKLKPCEREEGGKKEDRFIFHLCITCMNNLKIIGS